MRVVDPQRLGIRLERAVVVFELAFEEPPEPVVDRRAARRRRRLVLELALVEGDEVVPARARGVEALERLDRRRVEPEVRDLFIGRDRAICILQRLVADAGELVEDVALVVVAGRDLGAPLEHVDEVLVLAALLVDLFERDERLLVLGPELERAPVARLRELDVVYFHAGQLGDANVHADLFVLVEDVGRDGAIELHEIVPLRGFLGEALGARDPLVDGGLRRRFLQAARGIREGTLRIGERVLGGARSAREQLEARVELLEPVARSGCRGREAASRSRRTLRRAGAGSPPLRRARSRPRGAPRGRRARRSRRDRS